MATQRTDKHTTKAPSPAQSKPPTSTSSQAPTTDAPQGAKTKRGAGPDEGQQPFREAYVRYALSLVEAQVDTQIQADEALRTYADAVQSAIGDVSKCAEASYRDQARIQTGAQRPAEEALRKYAEASQASGADTRKVSEAYRSLSEALQRVQAETQRRTEEALQNYTKAQSDAHGRAAASLREYISALHSAPGDANAAIEAYRRYIAALDEILQQTYKRCEDAQRSYETAQVQGQQRGTEAVYNASAAFQEDQAGSGARTEAARSFSETMLGIQADMQHSAEEAARSQRESQGQARQRGDDAFRAYMTALQEVGTNAQKRQVDAYRSYVLGLQAAWPQLNVDAVVGEEQR